MAGFDDRAGKGVSANPVLDERNRPGRPCVRQRELLSVARADPNAPRLTASR
jgi:hypothetical protein